MIHINKFDRESFKIETMELVKKQRVDNVGRLLVLLDMFTDLEERRRNENLFKDDPPTTPAGLRPSVLAFARLMEWKLRRDDEIKGTHGWKDSDPDDLYYKMCQEATELGNAMKCNSGGYDVAIEAADVANFAMMIADAFDGLKYR